MCSLPLPSPSLYPNTVHLVLLLPTPSPLPLLVFLALPFFPHSLLHSSLIRPSIRSLFLPALHPSSAPSALSPRLRLLPTRIKRSLVPLPYGGLRPSPRGA
ncbi:hypothetical protein B0H14DRAFT_3453730 [Mycena olivaceomarginata]|nr:hypothetical protein B0H14DRAFT_3453730 [Mycena olivaceomarginata]